MKILQYYKHFSISRMTKVNSNGIVHDRDNIHPVPMIFQYQDIMKEALGQFPAVYIKFIAIDSRKFVYFRARLS